jgi:hypothetical protein
MQDEQWKDVIGRIQDTFRVLDHEVTRGDELTGDVESIEFETPQGKMKLERTSKPRVVGKTAIGSKRIGSSSTVKYQYSETDRVHTVKAYRWEDEAWMEISGQGGGMPLGSR